MREIADETIDCAMKHLRDDEDCHTVILYGSRARGDAGPDSDYDLIGFRDRDGPPLRETGLRYGGVIDISHQYYESRNHSIDNNINNLSFISTFVTIASDQSVVTNVYQK